MVLLVMIAIATPGVLAFLLLRWVVRQVRPGAWTLDPHVEHDTRRVVQRPRLVPGERPRCAHASVLHPPGRPPVRPGAYKVLRRLDARARRLARSH